LTTEIAPVDAYATAVSTVVAEVLSDGVVLERTVFYPRGGGQPGDTGVLTALVFADPVEGKSYSDVNDSALYWYFVVLIWIPFYFIVYVMPFYSRR